MFYKARAKGSFKNISSACDAARRRSLEEDGWSLELQSLAKFGATPDSSWKRRGNETCPVSAHCLLVFRCIEVPATVCNHVLSKGQHEQTENDQFDLRFAQLETCARYVFVSSTFLMVLCPSWHCNVATSCMAMPCLSLKGCWFNGLGFGVVCSFPQW